MHIYILISSDWHSGHASGVLAPGTILKYDDPGEPAREYEPNLSPGQERLWNVTQNVFTYAEKIAKDAPVILVQCGDIVHGNRFSEFLTSARLGHQIAIARQYLDEFIKRLNITAFYTIFGTDVHAFGEGSAEELIAESARDKYNFDAISAGHLLVNIDGVKIDIAHHGPTVGEAYLAGNAARWNLKRIMMTDSDVLGKTPADVYIRGHVHGYVSVDDTIERNKKFYSSRLLVCPPMCIPASFARRVTRSADYYRLGMLLLEILDGHLINVTPLLQAFDVRSYVTVDGTVAHTFRGQAV